MPLTSLIYSDDAPAWIDLRATHRTLPVNHSERYADGDVNTNLMESFFSRLRRMEALHHHIAGSKVIFYAWDCAWRENHNRAGDGDRMLKTLRAAMASGPSRTFSNLWRKRSDLLGGNDNGDDIFSGAA